MAMIFSDEIGLQQQQPAFIRADVPRASSRWYLLSRGGAAAAPSSFLPTWALNLAGNSRQLEKKQNHKKNPRANPRDILRGLAVKRDHFY
ncbi:hypothetical protein TYRP_006579 [Tyrophagus putrescentiae]|nr:hypothetical protein TYRP_006579 [Tyrophagus putrescentiae]